MDREAKGVLVVLDGSETSRRALDRAIELVFEKEFTLTLLAIVPPRLWRARQGQFQVSPEKHDEEYARTVLDEGKSISKARGVRATTRLRTGPPSAIICEEAARGFDVIVLPERRNLVGAPSLVSIVRDRLSVPLEVVAEQAER